MNSRKLNINQIIFLRNIVSFLCASLIIIFSVCGVCYGLLEKPNEITPERGVFIFHLFTVNSNLLSFVASIFVVSFTIQGLIKKKYEIPDWAFQVLYCATICVFLTFTFAMALIFPRNGLSAIIGMNMFFHLICPILCIILFYFVSSSKIISLLNSILAMIPFMLYGIIYTIMVLILGEENGGWRDIYQLFRYVPWYVALVIMVPTVFGISSLFKFTHNKVVYHRNAAIQSYIITEYGRLDKEELLQSVYNMGSNLIKGLSSKTIVVPLNYLNLIYQNNKSVSFNELIDSFTKGYLDSLKELYYNLEKNNNRVRNVKEIEAE